MASSIEAIQKILQETVAPGISDLRERLTRVEVEIKRLDDKIDTTNDRIASLRNEMLSEIRRLDDKMDNGFSRQDAMMAQLDSKIDFALEIRERLAALEAKVAAR